MRFDHTKQIFGLKKSTGDGGLQSSGASSRTEPGASKTDSDKKRSDDDALVEYRARDKQSFEELVRDQIQIHEANAAASAMSIEGSTSSMAQVLEAVDLAETRDEVDKAFGHLDGIDLDNVLNNDRRLSDDEAGQENEANDSNRRMGDADNDPPGDDASEDEEDDERDTLKPPRPVESIKITMLDSKPPAPAPIPDGEEADWSEVSVEELVELTDGAIPADGLVEVMASKSIVDDGPRTRRHASDVADLKKSSLSERGGTAISFEGSAFPGAPVSDDDLQVVRTSFPPPQITDAPRHSHNPWKVVALVALFVLAVMLGWHLKSQSNGFFNNAFSEFPGRRFSSDTHESPPHFSQTAMSGGEQVGVVTERENDMTAAIALTHGKTPTDIDSADTVGNTASTHWRRGDVDNPRKKRAAKSARRTDRQRKARSDVAASDKSASVLSRSDDADDDAHGSESTLPVDEAAAESAQVTVTSATPQLPSKSDVRDAMREIAPLVKSCRIDASGKLVLKMIVSGASGKIISSEVVDDTFRGTATGRCAVRAAQKAKLPIFRQQKLTIKYPFKL